MTQKLLIVLLADTQTQENLGRALHALLYAKQAKRNNMEVELIFDGGGTEWAAQLPGHPDLGELFEELLDQNVIRGVCTFCANAFDVTNEVQELNGTFIDEDNGHPDIGSRIADGWQPLVI